MFTELAPMQMQHGKNTKANYEKPIKTFLPSATLKHFDKSMIYLS